MTIPQITERDLSSTLWFISALGKNQRPGGSVARCYFKLSTERASWGIALEGARPDLVPC
jgi:hypothetical protein